MDIRISESHNETNFTSDNYLAINSCGFQRRQYSKNAVLRSKGRLDYHFLYITKGTCTAETPEGLKHLHAGDLLLYRPGEKQFYYFDPNDITESYWIHFAGYGAEEILKASDLVGQSVFHIGCNQVFSNLFHNIINAFVAKSNNIMSISWMLQLCTFAKRALLDNDAPIYDERISTVMKYMNQNYMQNHSLDYYARMCGLSRARFSHLFKTITGTAPHQYLSDIRRRQIEYLLTYSDMNINQIAAAVGFDDALYMSRFFRKNTGLSPSEYLERHRVSVK